MDVDPDRLGIVLLELEARAPGEMLDAEEYRLLGKLPDAIRSTAVRRIAVVHAWLDPTLRPLFGDAREAARRAGLSRSKFFLLLAKSEKPTLAGLGLNISRLEDKHAAFGRMDVVHAAGSMLAEDPELKTSELIRRLSAGAGANMSRTTLVRMIDEARSKAPAAAPFAKAFVLDAASLDVVDGAGLRQRLYALIDEGSGLLLGWTIAPDERFEDAYEEVARQILDPRFRRFDVAGLAELKTSPDPTAVRIAFGRAGGFHLEERAVRAGWKTILSPRRVGRAVVSRLGRSFAGVGVSAGFAPPDVFHGSGVRTVLPILDEALSARFADEVRIHNTERLVGAIKGDGPDGWEAVTRTTMTVLGYV